MAKKDAQNLSAPTQLNAFVPLDYPFNRGDKQIDAITLRKPKAGELRGLSIADIAQQDVNTLIKLLPRISDPRLTEDEVGNLDPADLMQLGIEAGSFFLPKAVQL